MSTLRQGSKTCFNYQKDIYVDRENMALFDQNCIPIPLGRDAVIKW